MNRIYQGKVSFVEIPTPGNKDNPWKPFDPDPKVARQKWQDALWQHHQIFQDAVNYYLVALASLADSEYATSRLIKDLQERIAAAWFEFPGAGGKDARSLHQSIAPWLNLSQDASPQNAFEAILDGNDASPQVRTLALALLLDRCGGESAIQQGGRGYFPRFCDAKTNPTYDFSSASQAAGMGKNRLAEVLHGESDDSELATIASEMDLSWTVKLQPDEFFNPEESTTRLIEAVEHVRNLLRNPSSTRLKEVAALFPDFSTQLDSFKSDLTKRTGQPVIPRNRKASKDLTFASLVFKFFPCALTAKVLSLFVKKPATGAAKKEKNTADFAACGDDPIKLARGKRGYVFRAFTALPAWNPKSPGEPVWKEFDIAAFKEALKSLNQFNQKTQERIEEEENLRGQIAILLGSEIKGWKPRKTDANEDEPIPEPLDSKLFQLARELERDLTQDLADTVVGEEKSAVFGDVVYQYREGEWQISAASLRGFSDIAEEWNSLYAKSETEPNPGQLEEVVKKHQRDDKSKNSIGSVPLFLKLCERKYWPLWLAQEEDTEESRNSFLDSMVSFHGKLRDLERALEPIRLTPAEPKYSRRLYMFSDIKDKTAKVVFGKAEEKFTVECAVAMRDEKGAITEQRVRLLYSAKRLLRDELQGGAESRWLQPMTKALGLEMPESVTSTTFDSAVSLMPDFAQSSTDGDRLRFLLNFPVTLDPSWIHEGLGKAGLWKGQFNGTRDISLHLHWPGTAKEKGNKTPWWENQQVIKKGFTCLSVDLGQRTAGAWALIRVTCTDPRKGDGTKRPVREVGFDGKRTWFAEVISTGILRLPGEDQKLIAHGKTEVEPFGKSGRNALEREWEEGKQLAAALLAENPEVWLGENYTEKSFPEQNDALIALANRRLSRLNTFHRWSCFDPDRPEIAPRRERLIEKLREEIEHWQDADVASWKSLLDAGDFAGFRIAAGNAFTSLRLKLGEHLLSLANRVAPLRKRSWQWDRTKGKTESGIYGELVDSGPQLTEKPTWIRGQRGLSLARIEQLENLRRLFLRYNRSFDREAGKRADFGRADFGRRSGEPCRRLLEKIERMKDQRVNQTAHLILAEALGVRLRDHQINPDEREARDIHGEYEKIPGREPVDFIVIENLDRYLTSQGRGPSENSRLMKWAHRSVRDKIKMLAEEPFGIPVVEAPAAYSSRFCAVTGIAGARCEERPRLDDYLKTGLEKRAKSQPKPGQARPEHFAALLEQFEQLEKLNERLQNSRKEDGKRSNSLYTLFLPKMGGPLFLPVGHKDPNSSSKLPRQADINAAINIGLRAIAAPETLSILHKIRAERDGDDFKPVIKNAREKAAFNSKSIIHLKNGLSSKLAKSRTPNFFFDSETFRPFDTATLQMVSRNVAVVSGVGLWSTVNELFPQLLVEINRRRLRSWQNAGGEEDNIPM